MIFLVFAGLFKTSVQIPQIWDNINYNLTIQLDNSSKNPVGARMVRTEVKFHQFAFYFRNFTGNLRHSWQIPHTTLYFDKSGVS